MQQNPKEDNSSISVFDFDNREIRVIVIDGQPWFVGKDVCDVLDLSTNTAQAYSRLKDYEKLTYTLHMSGQNRDVTCISESGLYRLVLTSRKPQAEPFQDWVVQEVLPSIRKTGSYSMSQPQPKNELEMIAALATGMSQLGTGLAQLANRTAIINSELKDLRDEHLDLRGKTEKLEKRVERRFWNCYDRFEKIEASVDLNHEMPDFAHRLEQMEATVRDNNYARLEAAQLLRGFQEDVKKSIPELTTRVKVRRLVVAFAQTYSLDCAVVFNRLYMEFRDRYHYDVKARCRKQKGSYLSQFEKDGKIEDFYAMAVKILCLPSLYSPWGREVLNSTAKLDNELT